MNELLEYIKRWAADFERELETLLAGLEKRVKRLERGLWREIQENILSLFNFDGQNLDKTTANIYASLPRLEALMNRVERQEIAAELRLFAEELLKVGGLTAEYYQNTAGAEATAAAIRNSLNLLQASLGITPDGGLVAGGYLDRLGKTEGARAVLREYVVQSIVTGKDLASFQAGFRQLVMGGAQTDGALRVWWRQYAYDSYNQAQEVVNSNMAEELKLNYFIYQGSIIPTSRQFCRKRAGKVFSKKEALTWKNDPDLIDQKTKATYNPFIERGRYNCRHFLNWISDELAFELRPELKKK